MTDILKRLLFETKFSSRGAVRVGLVLANFILGLYFFRFLDINPNPILLSLPSSLRTLMQDIPKFMILGLSGLSFLHAIVIWRQPSFIRSFTIPIAITCLLPLWFLLIFAVLFGTKFLLLCAFVIIALSVVFFWRISLKIAGVVSLITFAIASLSTLSNLEENYCWNQGTKADPTGIKMVTATEEDSIALSSFRVTPGSKIGVGFRAHMLCHDTFRFSDALRETLLPK